MTKKKDSEELSKGDLEAKQAELIKEFVKYKISLDPAVVENPQGFVGLRRELRSVSRKKAQASK